MKDIRPYQKEALDCMLELFLKDKRSVSSILSLPTGAGKTFTALKFAAECHKQGFKIIIVTPQIQILNQFYTAIDKDGFFEDNLSIVQIYNGGDTIKKVTNKTDIVLSTYQSLCNRMTKLKSFIKDNKVLLIIDEAHHAASKSHQVIINSIKEYNDNALILGLTATPYRTSEQEKGILSKTFTDGFDKEGNPVFGDIGIVYKADKQDLIHLGYLARPIFKTIPTDCLIGDDEITEQELARLYNTANLPDKIIKKLAESTDRNKLIVDTYLNDKDTYGQTIIFCESRVQVYALKNLFNSRGVEVGLAISPDCCVIENADLNKESIERDIKNYRTGNLQVLLTCQMIDEGFDVPDTNSVFLTMQTTSRRRLDQRIGRGMRPKKLNNTFYVVSFQDAWATDIDWVTPESLFPENGAVGSLIESRTSDYEIDEEVCSLSNFTDFVNNLDSIYEKLSTKEILDKLDSVQPIGFYLFDIPSQRKRCTITVLSGEKELFDKMVALLDKLQSGGTYLSEELAPLIYDEFFLKEGYTIVTVDNIRDFINYYVEYGMYPEYRDYESDFLKEVNAQTYASKIIEEDMRRSEKTKYLTESYNNSTFLKRYYVKLETFINIVTKYENAMCK